MLMKYLPVLILPLLVAGCSTTITNLTPQLQTRKADNLYPVAVALDSTQQTLLWETIRPRVVVDNTSYALQPTPFMTNRWEGLMPVPASEDTVRYQYQFDYDYNAMGGPKPANLLSPQYTLRIVPQPESNNQSQ